MKSKVMRVLIALSLLGMLAGSATQAQTSGRVVVEIPFRFVAGKAILPAGKYMVKPNTTRNLLLIQSFDDRVSATVFARPVNASAIPGRGKLIFRRYGDRTFLYQVWAYGETVGYQLYRHRPESELVKSASEPDSESLIVHQQ